MRVLGQKIISSALAGLFLLSSFASPIAAAPGDLDPTFGNGGIVLKHIADIGHYRGPSSIVVQPDGKILVAGQIDEYGDMVSFFIARFEPSGSPDLSFGYQGMIFPAIEYGSACVGAEIALQPDGKIVAVGQHGSDIAVHRYDWTGAPDTSFGEGGGIVFTPPGADNAVANSAAIQPDGKIVVAGNRWGNGLDTAGVIIRLDADGTLDQTFGSVGVATTTLPGWTAIRKVIRQADGRLLALGDHGSNPNGGPRDIMVARCEPDGSVDTSFGSNGSVIATFGHYDFYSGAALQPDGKILVAGWGYNSSGADQFRTLFRYNHDGSVDPSFSANTISSSNLHRVNNVAVQRDGRIVGFGYGNRSPAQLGFSVARLHANGSIDTSFGTNGGTVTTTGSADYGALAGALQPDGKILVLGTRFNDYDVYELLITRYEGDNVFGLGPGSHAIWARHQKCNRGHDRRHGQRSDHYDKLFRGLSLRNGFRRSELYAHRPVETLSLRSSDDSTRRQSGKLRPYRT